MIDFTGRSILVVGGGSGIGLSGALELAKAGGRVVVMDIDPDAGSRLANLNPDIHFINCDATSRSQVMEAVDAAEKLVGGLDHLLTTIGGALIGDISNLSEEAWQREFAFNIDSVFFAAQAMISKLKGRAGASMVFTSSGYANIPGPDRIAYTSSKAAIHAFTRSLAADQAKNGVRVNCIAPGPTDTPRFRAMNGGDAGVEQVEKLVPLGKIPKPVEVANGALFLLSPMASQITGQTLHINGGAVMP